MAPRGAGCRQALADRISENDTPFSWTSSQAWRLTFLICHRAGWAAEQWPCLASRGHLGEGIRTTAKLLVTVRAGRLSWTLGEPQTNKQTKVNKPCNPVIAPLSPGFVLRKGRGGAPGSLEHSPRGWCQVPAGEEVKGEPKWQHCAQPLPGHILTRS